MSITIRVPSDDDFDAILTSDARSFSVYWEPEAAQQRRPVLDLSRFRIACDGKEVVGLAGSMEFDLTLPGGAAVPAGGLTWVGVVPTHRRQGILTRLIDECHADMHERGDVTAMLHASEASIYGRFGYGMAVMERDVEIDLRRTRLRDEFARPDGSVRFVEGDAAFAHHARLWEPFRRQRPGELSRSPALHDLIRIVRSRESEGATPAFHLAHADGFASYRVINHWDNGHPEKRLEVMELLALTPAAHRALWQVLLSVDLVVKVGFRHFPTDDPLPYHLTNPRALHTRSLTDGLWLAPLDVATAFGARTYGTTDRLVMEVAGARYAIDGSPEGAEVRTVRTRPDLVLQPDAAGPLLLGGVRAGALAAAGRLTARNADALRRADRFFLADVAPCSTTQF